MFNYSLETLLRDEPTWPPVTERGEWNKRAGYTNHRLNVACERCCTCELQPHPQPRPCMPCLAIALTASMRHENEREWETWEWERVDQQWGIQSYKFKEATAAQLLILSFLFLILHNLTQQTRQERSIRKSLFSSNRYSMVEKLSQIPFPSSTVFFREHLKIYFFLFLSLSLSLSLSFSLAHKHLCRNLLDFTGKTALPN